ncbi:hypothetical protein NEF87_002682 [Candidatus Lokiarchaeum ossiferum]|uniref:Uncharacterized protein n=1 Tax=Candidatus Lokiarchaeum ossiferum TaxID=2951803 RepID=A0ABY6HS99_9ARCH|nr:hypothetical protein NEF87_002682 [Candidatus Lokiarchaeum sp. B-35]
MEMAGGLSSITPWPVGLGVIHPFTLKISRQKLEKATLEAQFTVNISIFLRFFDIAIIRVIYKKNFL